MNAQNWLNGVIADRTDATADFSTLDITSDVSLSLDTPRTIGELIFGDTTPSNNWTVTNNGSNSNVLTLAVSSGTPTIDVVNQTATISAVLAGAAGFTKTGAGTLVLDAAAANTYSGTTTVAAGILELGSSGAVGTSNVVVQSGGEIISTGHTYSAPMTLSGTGINGACAWYTPSSVDVFNGQITIAGGGASILTLSIEANNGITFNGGINIPSGNVLTVGGANNITVNSAPITGGGALQYDGSSGLESSFYWSILALHTANSYSGGTTISGGSIYLYNSSALGTGAIVINNGGELDIQNNNSCANAISIAGFGTGVLVQRELEFRLIGVSEWWKASYQFSRGIVPRGVYRIGANPEGEGRAAAWATARPSVLAPERRSGCVPAEPYPPPRSCSS